MSEQQIRRYVAALGLATVAFGATPLVAPSIFARLFGFPNPDASTASMMRSLGVRDVVMGAGLWSAASQDGEYVPWLLARLLTDGGDALAIAIGAGAGYRNRRFLALGAFAMGAMAGDAVLWGWARRIKKS